jgi:hypothetical protein
MPRRKVEQSLSPLRKTFIGPDNKRTVKKKKKDLESPPGGTKNLSKSLGRMKFSSESDSSL